MPCFSINGRHIGPGHPAWLIAEMSANHHQDLAEARDLIHAMHESGADAVKLQTYTPDTMTIDCDQPHFQVGPGTIWEGRRLHELYRQACTPWEWQAELFELARQLGMDCFSTPFDCTSVDFLEELQPPCYKIASFELVDLPLIEYVASRGRPIIMSTGMGTVDEIDDAVQVVRRAGVPLALLKCTSAYPAPPESMNLRTIPDLANRFGVPAGLSDHTLGSEVAIAAVALGACVIEKHFTLSRAKSGPDSAFSMEPHEFQAMVTSVRNTEAALGQVSYCRSDAEQASTVFRRSLFAVQDIRAGEPFTTSNVRCIRPGNGLPPKHLNHVLGQLATVDIRRGTPLSCEHLPLPPVSTTDYPPSGTDSRPAASVATGR
jgi:pseudaminic acid synthase